MYFLFVFICNIKLKIISQTFCNKIHPTPLAGNVGYRYLLSPPIRVSTQHFFVSSFYRFEKYFRFPIVYSTTNCKVFHMPFSSRTCINRQLESHSRDAIWTYINKNTYMQWYCMSIGVVCSRLTVCCYFFWLNALFYLELFFFTHMNISSPLETSSEIQQLRVYR